MGMTIEEVLKIIKDGRIAAIIIRGNNDDETKFNQENIEALNVIVETMRKYQKLERALDKTRAEIQENINYNKKMNYQGIVAGLLLTLDIIDKYKTESEEEE